MKRIRKEGMMVRWCSTPGGFQEEYSGIVFKYMLILLRWWMRRFKWSHNATNDVFSIILRMLPKFNYEGRIFRYADTLGHGLIHGLRRQTTSSYGGTGTWMQRPVKFRRAPIFVNTSVGFVRVHPLPLVLVIAGT